MALQEGRPTTVDRSEPASSCRSKVRSARTITFASRAVKALSPQAGETASATEPTTTAQDLIGQQYPSMKSAQGAAYPP